MAVTIDGTTGITTPGLTNTGVDTLVDLTTTGNTVIGNTTTDTLVVGVNGIVKDTFGNVGIGTASPTSADGGNKLEISNNLNTVVTLTATNDTTPILNFRSNSVDRLSILSSSNYGVYFNVRSNQDMRFGTNNTEKMRLDANGLGIGAAANTSPGGVYYNLNVGSQGGGGIISAGTDTYLTSNFYITGGVTYFAYSGSAYGSYYNQTAGKHQWKSSSAAGTGGTAATLNTLMTLDASGNLGINIAGSNNNRLTVQGPSSEATNLLTSATNAAVLIRPYSSSSWSTAFGSISGQIQYIQGVAAAGDTARDISIQPYGGNVGIGTASPSGKFHVAGTNNSLFTSGAGTSYVNLGNADGATNVKYTYIAGASGYLLFGRVSDDLVTRTETMRIDSLGNVGIGTTSTPLSKFGVNGDGVFSTGGNVLNAGGGVYFVANGVQVSPMAGIKGVLINNASGEDQGGLSFQTRPNGAAGQTLTERMRIDSVGNVGINEPSPVTYANGLTVTGTAAAPEISLRTNTTLSSTSALKLGVTSSIPQGGAVISSIVTSAIGQYTDMIFSTLANGSLTAKMRLDANGNFGIGTASPAYKLEVVNAATTPAAAVFRTSGFVDDNVSTVYLQDDTAWAIGVGGRIAFRGLNDVGSYTSFATIRGIKENATQGNNAGAMVFKTQPNGGTLTERMRIDSAGNVGIGVTPSAWNSTFRAQEFNTSGSQGAVSLQNNGSIYVGFNYYYDGTNWKYVKSSYSTIYQSGTNGQHAWYTAAIGTAGNTITFNQAMTLDASGQLAIGTVSTIASKLYVAGDTNDQLLRVGNTNATNTQYISIYANGAQAYYNSVNTQNAAYGQHAWSSQNNAGTVERMRIDGSGNLLFNSGYGSAATAYGCRAWVNYDGTTASPNTIRGSGNVTSVTKSSTGNYTVNFTTAMPDVNYACTGTCEGNGETISVSTKTGRTTSAMPLIVTRFSAGANIQSDNANINVAVFR